MYIDEYDMTFTCDKVMCVGIEHLMQGILENCWSINRFDKKYFCNAINNGRTAMIFTCAVDLIHHKISLKKVSYTYSGMPELEFVRKFLSCEPIFFGGLTSSFTVEQDCQVAI